MKVCIEYLHADLWRPSQTPTLGGNRYFLSIVDDFTRKVWVFPLRTKDQILEKFKTWKALVENQIDKRIKTLRIDNGLEFCNREFDEFCNTHGIIRHKTVRNTPQQNGVAERMNITLLENVRCLLFIAGMRKTFWGEALSTAAYLVNRSPSIVLNLKGLEEKWIGRKMNLEYLKVFGCEAYVYQSVEKLDPRSIKCVFVGYQNGTKGYSYGIGVQVELK